MISVIVPAHNEARVIGRLLRALVSPAGGPGDLEVIVVANGCADDTAEVAESFAPAVRVLSIPVASKREALLAGDLAARHFPRVYVDADVEMGIGDVRALVAELQRPGVLAAAPQRVLALTGRPVLVRWHYDVWTRLPEVRQGLFGRGVIAVSEEGHRRIAALPPVMADDLSAALAFEPHERMVVDAAHVVIHTPRTVADLLRRRIRVAAGTAQLERTPGNPESTARTRPYDLLAMARGEPGMIPRIALFLVVAAVTRVAAGRAVARGDFSTWLRDESSRHDQPEMKQPGSAKDRHDC